MLAKVISEQHKKSPIIKGGLEVLIEVTVQMENTEDNWVAMKEYEASVTLKYKEPVQGEYEDDTTSILAVLQTGFPDSGSSSGSDSEQGGIQSVDSGEEEVIA